MRRQNEGNHPPKQKNKKEVNEEVLARMGLKDDPRPRPSRRLKKLSEVNPH